MLPATRAPLALLLLLAASCRLDQGLAAKDEDPDFDSGDPAPDDTAPPTPEECNGVDDDGDGAVDEGYPDEDGNGRADCMDAECPPLSTGVAGPVELEPSCASSPVVGDPEDLEEVWTFTAPAGMEGWWMALSTPLAAQLGDDDGDGDIDEDDGMDVILGLYGTVNGVVALDGATGRQHWWYGGTAYATGTAVADLDRDGVPEVLVFDAEQHLVCLDHTGAVRWVTDDRATAFDLLTISVADLEGDGRLEILADDLLVEDDGTVRAHLDVAREVAYRSGVIGDADLDGEAELYLGGRAFDARGRRLWDSGLRSSYGSHAALWQVDTDPEAEVVFLGSAVYLFEADGSPAWSGGTLGQPGPPCIADFDGDGESELGVGNYDRFSVMDPDGTVVWDAPMGDFSGLAGCAGADLDGDGAAEAILEDHDSVRIWDVARDRRWSVDIGHRSLTGIEYPSVADLDGDGHAELLLPSSDVHRTFPPLRVFRHAGDGWAPAPGGWETHDFQLGAISAAGAVAPLDTGRWTAPGTLRARPVSPASGPDLTVALTDLCVADCVYGPAAAAVWVSNEGSEDVPAGTLFAVWAVDAEGERLVHTGALPALPAATSLDGIEIPLAVDEVGQLGLRVRVDDDGAGSGLVAECDEADNEAVWTETPCP